MKVAIIAPYAASGERGGAERFYDGLRHALCAADAVASIVSIEHSEATFEDIIAGYQRCAELDLSAYDLVISTKAPTFNIRHPNHIVFLVHTVRVFYDMFDTNFPIPTRHVLEQQRHIHALDTAAIASARKVFTIGHEVSNRLVQWNGIPSEVLHPPVDEEEFLTGENGDYFFLPGRLHPWKRVDLAIAAVKASSKPLKLVIAGSGEAEDALKELAAGHPRIEFRGRISDREMKRLYANARAVVFTPLREDYGYITVEAFASGKPVITCSDSGEPLQFVRHGQTGLVARPGPQELCAAMELLHDDPDLAREMGRAALAVADEMSWGKVAARLLEAGRAVAPARSECEKTGAPMRVAVLDMQPITPAVGGGRQRLLGLYHGLGDKIECRYVGSYDWEGEPYRKLQVTPSLTEITVPLSAEHHAADRDLARRACMATTIDISFSKLGQLSEAYLAEAREAISWSDVVVFSHPWIFPLVAGDIQSGKPVIYDSQNVESFLRGQILDLNNSSARKLLSEVIMAEDALGQRANLVMACSQEDLLRFNRIFEWPCTKMRVVPNGVFTEVAPEAQEEITKTRAHFGLRDAAVCGVFIGSAYGPNVDAANFIVREIAPRFPDHDFLIVGGVGQAINATSLPNVHVTGQVDEIEKRCLLSAATYGLNPMLSGSGTNIKMFDMMSYGLPVFTTEVGARGITYSGHPPFILCEPYGNSFVSAISYQVSDEAGMQKIRQASCECVRDGYSWERISRHTGNILRQQLAFSSDIDLSVLVPSYERPEKLAELFHSLEKQTWKNFEVVVVDQSSKPWPMAKHEWSFPVRYTHTDVKGAVRARNTAAELARGKVLAFVDDDCLPEADWLENGMAYFASDEVVGVEGLIYSDKLEDPGYRPVTNVGFEGIGFMTANLFVRAEEFRRLGGFDIRFDRPHFREDTDFGWRLQSLGKIPYAFDVRVFHPAQPRTIERESSAERVRFFEKDALLFQRHPEKYRELFRFEAHWCQTQGFWENFARGAQLHNVDISEFESYRGACS